MQFPVLRIYADAQGESHFSDGSVELGRVDFAPPAPAVLLSEYARAERFALLVLPSGYLGDFHPAPRKQFMAVLSGVVDTTVSDGEKRRIGPGTLVLLDDTTGKGHVTSVPDTGDVAFAVTQLL